MIANAVKTEGHSRYPPSKSAIRKPYNARERSPPSTNPRSLRKRWNRNAWIFICTRQYLHWQYAKAPYLFWLSTSRLFLVPQEEKAVQISIQENNTPALRITSWHLVNYLISVDAANLLGLNCYFKLRQQDGPHRSRICKTSTKAISCKRD